MAYGQLVSIPAEPTALSRMADLVAALEYEASVIDELRRALLRQRVGVAAADHDMVEAGLHAMGRTLLTLIEAKRRRATLTALIVGGEATPLDWFEVALGGRLTPEVQRARDRVRQAAGQAVQELAINQHILQRALEAGDAFLQQLFSMSGDLTPGHRQGEPAAVVSFGTATMGEAYQRLAWEVGDDGPEGPDQTADTGAPRRYLAVEPGRGLP